MRTRIHTHVSCTLNPAGIHESGSAKHQWVMELEVGPPVCRDESFGCSFVPPPGMRELDHLVLVHKDTAGLIFLSPELLGEAEEQRQHDLPAEHHCPLLVPPSTYRV